MSRLSGQITNGQHAVWILFWIGMLLLCRTHSLNAASNQSGRALESTSQEKKSKSQAEKPLDAASAQDSKEKTKQQTKSKLKDSPDSAALPVEKTWTKVAKDFPIWIDMKNKEVIVAGRVAVQTGHLEMFACPSGTKEHESVVAVDAPARFVHMALLAVGARPGKPVSYDPKYRAATGSTVEIEIVWRNVAGKIMRVRAQEWVNNAKTGKPLKYEWVFGGSNFWTDETSGERYYAADGGELICVSNFTTATLDLPIESSAANQDLLFIANSENIPKRHTPLQLILRPRKDKDKPETKGSTKPKGSTTEGKKSAEKSASGEAKKEESTKKDQK